MNDTERRIKALEAQVQELAAVAATMAGLIKFQGDAVAAALKAQNEANVAVHEAIVNLAQRQGAQAFAARAPGVDPSKAN